MRVEVAVPLSGGASLPATLCLPGGEPPPGGWPGVVVLHEIFGVQPEILAAADRFADAGWAAIVPDLFGVGARVGCLVGAMREGASGKPGRITGYVDAARGWLAERPDVAGDRLGAIGFCMGGGFALLYAAGTPPGLRAAAANYAVLPRDENALRDACPIVGSYGGRDLSLRGAGDKLAQRLASLGVPHDVKTYPAAGHSFMTEGHHPIASRLMVPMHLGYRAEDADDAWQRVFAFFDTHVRG